MTYKTLLMFPMALGLCMALGGCSKSEKVGARTPPVAVDSGTHKTVSTPAPIGDEDRAAAVALVKTISQDKATVADVFRGPGEFLGVVVSAGEGKFIGWMPRSRDTLVVGAMFDKTGKNITQSEMLARGYAQTAVPTGDADKAAAPASSVTAAQAAVEKTTSYTEGTAGPLVTAFVDFNCGYCREFFQRSRAYIAQGTIRVRWIPVAILSETSLPKAAAVLGNADPASAMAMAEDGILTPINSVSQSMKEKIGANTAVLNLLANGNPGTPTLMIRRADGTYNISPGLPQNLLAFINDGH